MGEAKRRKQTDPNYGKSKNIDATDSELLKQITLLDLIGFTRILKRLEKGEKIADSDLELQEMRLRMLMYPKTMKTSLGIDVLTKPGKVKVAHILLEDLLKLIGLSTYESTRLAVDRFEKVYSIATHAQVEEKLLEDAVSQGVQVNPYETWSLEDGRKEFFDLWLTEDIKQCPEAIAQFAEPFYVDLTDLDQVIADLES